MTNYLSNLGTDAILAILHQSNSATAIYTGDDLTIQLVNDSMLRIWKKNRSVHGKSFEEALPELKGQPFTKLLKNVWKTGEIYDAQSMPATLEINGELVTSYFDFTYKPIIDEDGKIYCILHTATDVTERVNAWNLIIEKEKLEQEINEELSVLNEKMQNNNQELNSLNKDYNITNEQLDQINKKYQENIIDLDRFNKILENRNNDLKELNDTILQLNANLSETKLSFSNLIEQAPVATMLCKGEDFIITMINKSMLELIGKDASIIGKPLFEQLPELKGQGAADALVQTFREGRSHTDYSNPVLLNRRGSLEKSFFNFTYTPFIENGKVTGVIDMAMEVTPQVMAINERDQIISKKNELEENLRESEQRLQGILDTMAEGVGIIDLNGQLVYANAMAQQILGLNESLIKDRTFDDPKWQNLRLDGTPLLSEEHPMAIMLSTGKPVYDHEIGVQPPDRERFYISINAAPIFDKDGKISGGIGTFMDVTARRIITQGKDDFISIASHELKTPVTSLKASLQLLQRSQEKLSIEKRAMLFEQSIKSLDKLSHLITDLLDTSRIEQGQLKLDKKSFILKELFEDCRDTLSPHTDMKIIFEGDRNYTLKADHQQIGQVLTNFINNAIKYAPNSKKIIIRAERVDESNLKISVIDFGPGIPKHKLQHLFERYYRTNYKDQKFTGLGLGLYISAEIIKNHGGKIGVESDEGKGSAFWFTISLKN